MYTVTIGCGTYWHETHDRLGRQDGTQVEEHGNTQGGQNTDMTKGARESERETQRRGSVRGCQRAREDKRERDTRAGETGSMIDRVNMEWNTRRRTWEQKRETRYTFCYKVGICRFSWLGLNVSCRMDFSCWYSRNLVLLILVHKN